MIDHLGAGELRSVVVGYRDALRAHQERLNRLNVYPVPDGDTGTNMALTLEAVVAELGALPELGAGAGAGAGTGGSAASGDDIAQICRAISHGSLMGARGNSGVILSQVMRGLTDRLTSTDKLDGNAIAEALAAASAAAYQAVMRPVEGTILTVVREASEAAQAAAREPGATLASVLDSAASAGADALERTPQLLPVLADAGVVDAGAAGFLLLLDVLLNVVDGRAMPEVEDSPVVARHAPAASYAAVSENVGDLRYEVMFLLEGDGNGIDAFKRAWAAIGDSIVVVGGDGLWNCHIHTNDIGAAVEAGIAAGRPRNIRVTDLAEQVEAERCERGATATEHDGGGGTAVVAVGAGDGAISILRSLGASRVVSGGQSMNPSTADLLDAINAVNGAEVVVLPNNKNVIPVAEKAAEVATKVVRVVPTTSLAEGFAALTGYASEATAATNAESMLEAADHVSWGEVTWAVRDATTTAGPVKEGDYLGLLGHEIAATAPGLADTACALLDKLVGDGHELVTVVEGEAATDAATAAIEAWLAEHRPDVAVEVHRGDQPLAAYLFSTE